jgi:uncharacterized protein YjcR
MGEEMSGGGEIPAAAPDWVRVRKEYEGGAIRLGDLAELAGVTPQKLMAVARREGWKPRRVAGSRPVPVRSTIARLKSLLQQRLAALDGELEALGAEATAANSERDIRAINTLVRTLEKVLELERRDRAARAKRRKQHRDYTDADRQALAERLKGLAGGSSPGHSDEPAAGRPPGDHR